MGSGTRMRMKVWGWSFYNIARVPTGPSPHHSPTLRCKMITSNSAEPAQSRHREDGNSVRGE